MTILRCFQRTVFNITFDYQTERDRELDITLLFEGKFRLFRIKVGLAHFHKMREFVEHNKYSWFSKQESLVKIIIEKSILN